MQNTKREKNKLLILFLTGGCCGLLSGLVLLNSHILDAFIHPLIKTKWTRNCTTKKMKEKIEKIICLL